ncbi:MAG: S1 RNA-binding domain-containing protein, partial [Pseudomonadota bacterium]|nr:S1 RNA-binding domain-containing protein [Pseudomonadota bacterium]
ISLGIKQLESDPWDDIEARFPLETRVTGRVTNITDYGAFVELGSGIEGLVHVSEMSWVKKNVHPGKIVSTSQEVEVMVLEVDSEKRRISLGLKQCMVNPWEDFASRYPVGTKVSGEIKNITEFGLFVGLEDEIDGMVHMSDLDWNLSGDDALAGFSKGQTVDAVVLDVDMDKERVSLGVKQLDGDPFESLGDLRRGSTVTCEVTAVTDSGLEVGVGDADVSAFIRRSDLSRDREDQRPERFNVGDKLDAMVTNIDQRARRIGLSIKALEIAEEKEAVEQYGSSDSGASLGDILGAALNRDDAGDDNSDVESDDGETEKD